MFKFLKRLFLLCITGVVTGIFAIVFGFFIYGKDLPNFDKLSYYQPRLVSKIFTTNGNFLEDYSNENRIFINYNQIPRELINCFLVSEDINFTIIFELISKALRELFLKICLIFLKIKGQKALQQSHNKLLKTYF